MPRSLTVLFSIIAIALVAGGGYFAWTQFMQEDDYEFNGGFFEPPRETHELINAIDQNGDPFTFAEHADKSIFVYFGYTHCPDACPATLAEWREVKAELGEGADDVVFVMITVDPERDTPEVMDQYLGFWDEDFYGVSMSPEDTEAVTSQWGITVTKEEGTSASGYLVTHDVSSYVIDPDGQLRLTYPLGFDPADMAEDIRHLNEEAE